MLMDDKSLEIGVYEQQEVHIAYSSEIGIILFNEENTFVEIQG